MSNNRDWHERAWRQNIYLLAGMLAAVAIGAGGAALIAYRPALAGAALSTIAVLGLIAAGIQIGSMREFVKEHDTWWLNRRRRK